MFKKDDTVGLIDWSGYGRIIHVLDNDRYLVLVDEANMEVPMHVSELYVVKTDVIIPIEVFNVDDKRSSSPKKQASPLDVIDLHIERIPIEFKRKMQDIEAQMAYFEHNLNHSINQRKSGITFIHGKGNGILKTRITKVLREKGFAFSDPERELNQQNAKLFVKLR